MAFPLKLYFQFNVILNIQFESNNVSVNRTEHETATLLTEIMCLTFFVCTFYLPFYFFVFLTQNKKN